MPEALYTCSKCLKNLPRNAFHEFKRENVNRPVTAMCRRCRKESRMAKIWDTVCACCREHRPLDTNGICPTCNKESGLKQCQQCQQVLPLFLSFTQRYKTCKECLKRPLEAGCSG